MNREIRIVSIGAVVQDVFLIGKIFAPQNEDGMLMEEFKLGEKYEVDEVVMSSGGGASNAAATFARQGLHSTFIGKLGSDPVARILIDELHNDQIETGHVHMVNGARSGYSTILISTTGERTILSFRADSTKLSPSEIDLLQVPSDWIYLSSLDGNFELLEHIVNQAALHGIKVALNPGKGEIAQTERLCALLPKITVLGVNKEEMLQLIPAANVEASIRIAADHVPYVVVTDGPSGVMAAYDHKLYKAGTYREVPVIDRTGAGDAFHSGFTAYVAMEAGITQALTFGSANSTSVVQKVGAKAGILPAETVVQDMPIMVTNL